MQVNIEIDREHVVVEGVKVPRPSSLSPSQWLMFWEDAVAANDTADAKSELESYVSDRDDEIKELKERLTDILAPAK